MSLTPCNLTSVCRHNGKLKSSQAGSDKEEAQEREEDDDSSLGAHGVAVIDTLMRLFQHNSAH